MKYRLVSATLLATLALPAVLGTAVAYIGENPYVVKLEAPREVACGEPVEITARVRSSDTADPAVEQIVIWDLKESLSPEDSVKPSETITDETGFTAATLTFGQVEGERTVRVEVATWPTTIRVSCVGATGVASPSPSAAVSPGPTSTPAPSPSPSASAPSITPTVAPTAAPTPSTDSGSMTAAILPIALVVLIVAALGSAFVFLRRR